MLAGYTRARVRCHAHIYTYIYVVPCLAIERSDDVAVLGSVAIAFSTLCIACLRSTGGLKLSGTAEEVDEGVSGWLLGCLVGWFISLSRPSLFLLRCTAPYVRTASHE